TLVLRTDLSGQPTVRALLARVREVCLNAYAQQDVPFERVVEAVQPQRALSHTPLFQVMFVLQNTPRADLQLPGVTVASAGGSDQQAKFDLTLTVTERDDELRGSLEYATDLFDAERIERLAAHFTTLLAACVAQPDQPITSLPLLTTAERRQLLGEWNATQVVYPGGLTTHQLFEAQVARTPDAVAVRWQDEELTYRELHTRAHQLAHHLRSQGVGPEVRVGVCLERSPALLVALLGVLLAGGCYVPLDPTYPADRLSFMLADSQAPLLVTRNDLIVTLATPNTQVIDLDSAWPKIAETDSSWTPSAVDEDHLAYLIYTSGSTGVPKGVAITHHNAVTMLHWAHDQFTPEERAGVLAATSVCFDLSVFEIFMPLSWGGCVVLADTALHLPTLAAAAHVTLVNTVPSAIAEILSSGSLPPGVRVVNLAGEPLAQMLSDQLYALGTVQHVYNLYGPSEDTTYSTFSRVTPGVPPAIGRPLPNSQVYVLDAYLQPAPIGVPGEVYLGGDGLARGYLGRPELTAEKFIPDPFSQAPGKRLYRTGDLACYQPDGQLMFLGRIDHQIKLRGFRIELGEIEAVLRRHPAVREAVVLVRDERLVAYVVGEQTNKAGALWAKEQKSTMTPPSPITDEAEARRGVGKGGWRDEGLPSILRAFLSERLPGYMIPSTFMQLDVLPLTPNGKIDRRALSALAIMRQPASEALLMPRDSLELQLVHIWEELLDVRPIGVTDNFFNLGGHSLLSVRLRERIRERFGYELPLTLVFQGPTIEQLAQTLRQEPVQQPESPLVALQSGGVKPPLVFIHPIGGSITSYLNLARYLDREQPFYAAQSPMLMGADPAATIEALAARYIDELKQLRPQGPYRLGGWSFGGIVAFEMAQQLSAHGDEVEQLVLLDTYLPEPQRQLTADDAQLLLSFCRDVARSLGKQFPITYADLAALEPESRLAYAFDRARELRLIPADLSAAYLQMLFDVYRTHLKLLQAYVPRSYSGSVMLFRADEQLANGIDAAEGWAAYLTGRFVCRETPGDHYSLLQASNGAALAEAMNDVLR
ncbi:MAG TPA: amino acid adenylation domain-containing protein, partial [Herpetosiphonaceae bacterium]